MMGIIFELVNFSLRQYKIHGSFYLALSALVRATAIVYPSNLYKLCRLVARKGEKCIATARSDKKSQIQIPVAQSVLLQMFGKVQLPQGSYVIGRKRGGRT